MVGWLCRIPPRARERLAFGLFTVQYSTVHRWYDLWGVKSHFEYVVLYCTRTVLHKRKCTRTYSTYIKSMICDVRRFTVPTCKDFFLMWPSLTKKSVP